MRPFLTIARLLVGAAPWAMMRGAALALTVLLMGAALLGLSGWFITAAGMAGLAGIGIAFDVFRPSAGVRFLALGRTAARYGERLLTHDATLRALAALRVDLLRRQVGRGIRAMESLRSEAVLTRIVADVDALDGIVLRLLLPALAGLLAHAVVFAVLGLLVGWLMAVTILLAYLPLSVLVLALLARRGLGPSRQAENRGQALRRGLIDLIRDRETLILTGQLGDGEAHLVRQESDARQAACALDRLERNAGFALSVIASCAAAAALLAGAWMVRTGATGPALAAIGVFVALALVETVQPLRWGAADFGRMRDAAGRVAALGEDDSGARAAGATASPCEPLLSVRTAGLDLVVRPGEQIALTGPSGAGKTTLLLQIAGLLDSEEGSIALGGIAPKLWIEADLRAHVGLLAQRSALMAGTVRENLLLAGDHDDPTLRAILDRVLLTHEISGRGGLDLRLGEAGSGLSGGQARRLCLARALLRRPALLLLDEPLEGLDEPMARRLLENLRTELPGSGILVCLHRHTSEHLFDRKYRLVR